MTEEQPFLTAIIENPNDDVPRLIYADWLDDHGQEERAELIRVQCALARGASSDLAPGLAEREKALLASDWAQNPCRGWLTEYGYAWRRGFVELIVTFCDPWLTHGPEIVKVWPTIQTVGLADKEPHDSDVFSAGQFRYRARWTLADSGYRRRTPEYLPNELFSYICDAGLKLKGQYRPIPWWFLTKEDAVAALSQACLAYARDGIQKRQPATI